MNIPLTVLFGFLAVMSSVVSSASADTQVPPESTGQTVVWRETFGSPEITPKNPGTLTAVTDGTLWGRLPNGPTWKDGDMTQSFSASARNRREGEDSQSVTFSGYREIPDEQKLSGMVSIWIRPSGRQQIDRAAAFSFTNLKDERIYDVLLKSESSSPTLSVSAGQSGDVAFSIPYDEWTLLWVSYQRVGTSGKFDLWAQTGTDQKPFHISHFETGWAWKLDRVSFNYSSFAGRIGPVTLYRLSSPEAGNLAPGGFIWPDNASTTWKVTVDGKDDYGNKELGDWEGLRQAMIRGIVLGRWNKEWTNGKGENAGYETLKDAAAKKQWWLDWCSGKYKAMGDRVEFSPGIYRVKSKDFPLIHNGIQYFLAKGAPDYSVDLRMSAPLTGPWSQPDAATLPHIWRYDGDKLPYRCVWGKEWQSFMPVSSPHDKGPPLSAMNQRPWAVYTDPLGITYISLPDKITPTDIGPVEGSEPNSFSWTGAWLGKVLIGASSMYDYDQQWGPMPNAGYPLNVVTGPHISVVEARSWRAAKHTCSVTGDYPSGLAIFHQVDVGFNPPGPAPTDPTTGFGAGPGGFTSFVDFCSASTTEEHPGEIVTIYDGVTDKEPTEPGDGTSKAMPARNPLYYSHGITGRKMFALTIFRDPGPDMFPKGGDHTIPDSNHVAVEIIPGPDSPPDLIPAKK